MERTPIQKHATALVKGMIAQSEAIGDIEHQGSKGKLRELFVENCLQPFLTSQFGLGTGHIINHAGEQSPECDIIVYDKRLVPPFIMNRNLGLFPFESVLAVIEVKSILDSTKLNQSVNNFKEIAEVIYDNNMNYYYGYFLEVLDNEGNLAKIELPKPILAIIAFRRDGIPFLTDKEKGTKWLLNKAKYLSSLCVVGSFNWLHINTEDGPEWRITSADKTTNEETKRFIFTLLDNVRSIAEIRYNILAKSHHDWLVYI